MLFSSFEFVLIFLPLTWMIFATLRLTNPKLSIPWLAIASCGFYAYWSTHDAIILCISILINFCFGLAISTQTIERNRKLWLWSAIICNLLTLFHYKYTQFVLDAIGLYREAESAQSNSAIAIPLGISFFTFTQIAYLVDVFKYRNPEKSPIKYILFVTYFPHLIAGPVIHHKEMMPQFSPKESWQNIRRIMFPGFAMFLLGLFKKVIIADTLAISANAGFASISSASGLNSSDAWLALMSYSLQIYFDFSGYSDMAVGISACFGIKLPINFYSPYRATSLIGFWHRWHMTLSRFLRDYVYITLGGNRHGTTRRYVNLFLTMLIGGIWHGAGWTFIIWGAIHGAFLAINHGWNDIASRVPFTFNKTISSMLGWTMTFAIVNLGWVFFRSAHLPDAMQMLSLLSGSDLTSPNILDQYSWLWVGLSGLIVLCMPNIQDVFRQEMVALFPDKHKFQSSIQLLTWQPSIRWLISAAALGGIAVGAMGRDQLFLYFNF